MRLRLVLVLCVLMAVLVPTALAGSASPPPFISFDPASADFGTIALGTTASKTFTLKNMGLLPTLPLRESLPNSSSAFSISADGCKNKILLPRKTCTVTVTYAPTSAGSSDTGTLRAQGLLGLAVATATLTGSAGSPDLILLGPVTYAGTAGDGSKFYNYFGTTSSTVSVPFSILNNGNVASQPLVMPGGGDGVVLLPGTCAGSTLAAHGGLCSFTLLFVGACPYPGPPQQFTAFVDVLGPPAHYIHLDAREMCIPI